MNTAQPQAPKVCVINGPNLNRLGKRQPEVYGTTTLADVEDLLAREAASLGIEVDFFQSNHEGELLDRIHRAADEAGFVEVHISNVHAREEFRHHSYLSPLASGVIAGLGIYGYVAALRFFAQ